MELKYFPFVGMQDVNARLTSKQNLEIETSLALLWIGVMGCVPLKHRHVFIYLCGSRWFLCATNWFKSGSISVPTHRTPRNVISWLLLHQGTSSPLFYASLLEFNLRMDSYFDPFKKEVRFLYNNESKEKKINPACLVTGKEKLNIPFHYLNLFIFLDDPLFFSDLKKIFHSLNVSGPRLVERQAAGQETESS